MNRRTPTLLLLALAAAVGLSGCVNRTAQKQAAETAAIQNDPRVPVRVVTVEPESVEESLSVTGEIATDDDTVVAARVSGRL
ncbi:MAG: hypothetical protein MH204_02410, partial [Fimbriimonadaceae bacterium]|nr:hypothetical protein [Fimbriimonadaceae bacterium]